MSPAPRPSRPPDVGSHVWSATYRRGSSAGSAGSYPSSSVRPGMSTQPDAGAPVDWQDAGAYTDIRYELSGDGIAKITINRPEVRNAFRPQTLIEISDAMTRAREDLEVGVIV